MIDTLKHGKKTGSKTMMLGNSRTAVRFGKSKKRMRNLDPVLFSLVLVLSVAGIIVVYSATKSYNSMRYVWIQGFACVVGIGLIYIVPKIDYERLAESWRIIFITNMAMLLLVLIFGSGSDEWGTRGWLRLGVIGIQPAEFVKIGFIITFACHLNKVRDNLNAPRNIIALLVHLAAPVALIVMQPDVGTSIVFVFIFLIMIFVSGISWKYIVTAGVSFAAVAPIIYFFVLSEFQKNRILDFLNPARDPLGSGYQVMQSKIAIGSGRILGKGLLKGTQNQLGFLPEKHNDFIFAVVGEELGIIGAIVIVVLLLALVIRILYVARNSKDFLGMIMCTGVGAFLLFHIVENIGMSMGLMPVTGIGLPFISYGGSSTITFFLGVALVFNVYIRRRVIYF